MVQADGRIDPEHSEVGDDTSIYPNYAHRFLPPSIRRGQLPGVLSRL